MTLEEILKHPRVSNIDVRHVTAEINDRYEIEEFVVSPFIWREEKDGTIRCRPCASEFDATLDEALAKVVARFGLDK